MADDMLYYVKVNKICLTAVADLIIREYKKALKATDHATRRMYALTALGEISALELLDDLKKLVGEEKAKEVYAAQEACERKVANLQK